MASFRCFDQPMRSFDYVPSRLLFDYYYLLGYYFSERMRFWFELSYFDVNVHAVLYNLDKCSLFIALLGICVSNLGLLIHFSDRFNIYTNTSIIT